MTDDSTLEHRVRTLEVTLAQHLGTCSERQAHNQETLLRVEGKIDSAMKSQADIKQKIDAHMNKQQGVNSGYSVIHTGLIAVATLMAAICALIALFK